MQSTRVREISDSTQIVLVVGSNRTGTSLMAEILLEMGFEVPGETAWFIDYDTHESTVFKRLSQNWNEREAAEFVAGFPEGKLVLKYPKASRVIDRWLRLMPDARVIYVFRRRDEAVESSMKYSWKGKPFAFAARWYYRWEWNRGLLAVANLPVPVAFVSFEELKQTGKFEIPESFGWS